MASWRASAARSSGPSLPVRARRSRARPPNGQCRHGLPAAGERRTGALDFGARACDLLVHLLATRMRLARLGEALLQRADGGIGRQAREVGSRRRHQDADRGLEILEIAADALWRAGCGRAAPSGRRALPSTPSALRAPRPGWRIRGRPMAGAATRKRSCQSASSRLAASTAASASATRRDVSARRVSASRAASQLSAIRWISALSRPARAVVDKPATGGKADLVGQRRDRGASIASHCL